MSKFFVNKSQIKGSQITISGQDTTHISKVLRLKTGDDLLVCDGEGNDYASVIESVSKEQIICSVLESFPCKNEPEVKVTLYQGLPKQGKMEWIIEKCTEIGISTIVPVQMTRSVVKLDSTQAPKKQERWQKTANEAAKQCGRGVIPQVMLPVKLQDLKQEDLPDYLLVPYEEEKAKPIKETLRGKKEKSVGIFIGPEGGFTEDEIDHLTSLGANCVTLGPRILRTETAGIVTLSLVLYEFDEMQCL